MLIGYKYRCRLGWDGGRVIWGGFTFFRWGARLGCKDCYAGWYAGVVEVSRRCVVVKGWRLVFQDGPWVSVNG